MKLDPGTPGVIWSVLEPGGRPTPAAAWRSGRALFVTLDGGRYITSISSLTTTRPATEVAPLHDRLLFPYEITELTKRGQLAPTFAAAIDRASQAWTACQATTWKAFETRWQDIKIADLLESTRANRRVALVEQWTEIARARCTPHADAYEAALISAIDARSEARQALLHARGCDPMRVRSIIGVLFVLLASCRGSHDTQSPAQPDAPRSADGGTGSSSNGVLKIIDLTATSPTITGGTPASTENGSTTFIAIVTDSQGLDAIAGGELVTTDGTPVAAFENGSPAGTYTATISFEQLDQVTPLDD